jgi:glyoxylase-like metal-dependent hydrolase (beta-lactamase superfamily II)
MGTVLLRGHRRRVMLVAALACAGVMLACLWASSAASAGPRHGDPAPAGAKASSDNWWDSLPRASWARFPVVKLPRSCAWFEVHKVAPGVFAIWEPGNWQEVISYLIVGEDRALLWDTGMDIGDMRLCVSKLTDLPVTVLNSHAHFDHMGGDYQFKRVWNVDVRYAHEVAENGWSHEYVAGWETPDTFDPNVPVPARYDAATVYGHPYQVTRWVHPGDRFDLGDRVLRIVATPGHSPDGISLYDRSERLLFVGDAFYLDELYAFIDGSDLAQYTATASRLAALAPKVRHVMPSHMTTMISPKWLGRMDAAFQAIHDGTATAYEDYPDEGIRIYDFGRFAIDVLLSDVTP